MGRCLISVPYTAPGIPIETADSEGYSSCIVLIKETISAALGHEIGSEVTSIYINFDRKKIDEANRKVIDYLNSVKADIS
ncbi:MAG: hypothetical protein SPF60_03250, partial [Lachnospiraceae bacterium]|nr:hypothetical protein [Lachnospiraceae bacterium]